MEVQDTQPVSPRQNICVGPGTPEGWLLTWVMQNPGGEPES